MIVKRQSKAKKTRAIGRTPYWLQGDGTANGSLDDKALAVFQPDTLLSDEFLTTFRRKSPLEPEKVLMLAILEDAVNCFQDNVGATCKRKRNLHEEAETWILDDDRAYFFSFGNVCEALGYDPGYVRSGLLRWKHSVLRQPNKKDQLVRLAS